MGYAGAEFWGCPLSLRSGLLAGVIGLVALLPLRAQQAGAPPLLVGAAWYPEQWPESRWDADLTLMEQAHLHVVRVGEFAWSTMEPAEGDFEFGWLDRAIAMAAKHHIVVVLGTPSAAPPAWLTTKYPQTLRVEEDGRRAEHGNRQQFSANDVKYRELAVLIAGRMAERYGHNANVLGWQIDNEISAPTFDDEAKAQWHAWLARKYGNVAEMNRRWATAYWSQTYDRFDEVPFRERGENPALLLDYKHFVTDTWISYVQDQVRAIRAVSDRRQWITTNTMGWFDAFDHYKLHEGLDKAAWDDYFQDGHPDVLRNAALHDLVRGFKGKNFWVMETQPGFVNWGQVNRALDPGVTREMAWQAVGHGADAVLYWQWRSALNGQEQYHGTLVGADGLPVPVYGEIAGLGAEFARVNAAMPEFTLTTPRNSVAIIQSYEGKWAIEFQRHTSRFDYEGSFMSFYRAVDPLAEGVDVVSTEAPLGGYKVVFAPALNVLSDGVAAHLLEYVRGGGHLVLGPRSGMKDADDGLQPKGQPGPLIEALGAKVKQYYTLDAPVAVAGDAGTGKASVWAEELDVKAPDAKVLLTYGEGDGWLTGKPAAVSRQYGKGEITYFGSDLDAGLMKLEAAKLLKGAGVKAEVAGLPDGVEMMDRGFERGGRVLIFINHTGQPVHVEPGVAGVDLLSGAAAFPASLEPHGVVVWRVAGAR